MTAVDPVKPTYVYGLVKADTTLPEGLAGLGPSGRVSTIVHGHVAAIVSDVPVGRPLGARGDLVAHETVLDAVASRSAVVPMRFPAVVEEDVEDAEDLEDEDTPSAEDGEFYDDEEYAEADGPYADDADEYDEADGADDYADEPADQVPARSGSRS